jgi:hypothetical protein
VRAAVRSCTDPGSPSETQISRPVVDESLIVQAVMAVFSGVVQPIERCGGRRGRAPVGSVVCRRRPAVSRRWLGRVRWVVGEPVDRLLGRILVRAGKHHISKLLLPVELFDRTS